MGDPTGSSSEDLEYVEIFLRVLRSEGWLADLLRFILKYWEWHGVANCTPEQIQAFCGDANETFALNLEIARKMLRSHANLVMDASTLKQLAHANSDSGV